MWWTFLLSGAALLNTVQCQSPGSALVPSVGSDYFDRGPDNSYRFGFQTGDKGGHYHAAIASKDNQVGGRFGARDPASGRIQETQYTAGQRGFRARGPAIARRMDLSQAKIPYNPPVNPNSPNYNPTYDTYHDPNEDPSYSFEFNTPVHQRKEASDSKGRVDGAYTYVDDIGERHDVRYEAGARIGFNVKTPFPDSRAFTGLFYRGPTKPGGPPRGKTSIQQTGDGAYRFVSAGPDQRRAEVSDKLGNVRGSYTYIDDKGLQRTVEYIAGPNIGYKVINKGVGPNFPPIPAFVPPQNLFPNFPTKFEELNPNNIVGPGSSGPSGGDFGDLFGDGGNKRPGAPFSPTQRPPFGSTSTSDPDFLDLDPFPGSTPKPPFTGQGGFNRPGSQPGSGGFGSSGESSEEDDDDDDLFGGPSPPPSFPDRPGKPQGGRPPGRPGGNFPGSKPPGGFQGSKPGSGFQGNKPGNFPGSKPPGSKPQGSFGNKPPGGNGGGGGGGFPGSGPPGPSGFPGSGSGPSGSGFQGSGPSGPSGGFQGGQGSRPGQSPSYPSGSSEEDLFGGPGPGSSEEGYTTIGSTPGSGPGSFEGYPSGRPEGASLFPGDLPNNCCDNNAAIYTTTAPPSPSSDPTTSASSKTPFAPTASGFDDELFPPLSAFPEDDPSIKKPRPSPQPSQQDDGDDLFGGSYDDPPSPNKFQKGRPSQNKPEPPPDDDNSFLSSNKNFVGFPPGVSIKARVQSLDLLPYGSRIPPPGLALDRNFSHNR